ncbi:heparan-alpha-glucosaminide N-acetyltransferase domain-containing protein [Micromonospora sp. WMMD812]|uniref:heparan-alpha-glucosaminide N-acetyltransferase domain-containing protein n=1 Tax=Micromonospora sp. WMMD812 TaxID=3015152 RepID=UPI00248CAF10|nr:heparan-alpha-glucosaminide N-acetyltransferase domain-containing protein [Micromonospora sp. WMMD812]WBB68483.1 heparan-alpha-glucosaminide N-acetyltransferase domain-containing protein [Micromonospora sp. WMMD812]
MTQTANLTWEDLDRAAEANRRAAVARGAEGAPPTRDLPVGRSRLLGVDAARGVALIGMIAVHSLPESDAAGRPTWWFTAFGGRASALFAVLAGLGIAFLTDRRRVRPAAGSGLVAALVVRALAIGAIGLALGYTDGSLASVILPYYAVMFVLAIPLVFLPTWLVAFTGVVVAAGASALLHVLPQLPEPSYDNAAFAQLVDDPVPLLTELSLTGEFPAVTWLAYLCAGLVIGRLTLTRRRVLVGLLTAGIALAAAAPVASWVLLDRFGGAEQIALTQAKSGLDAAGTAELLTLGGDGTTPTSTWWWLAVDAPHTGTPLDLLGTTGSAIALIAVMLLAGRVARSLPRRVISVLLVPLAAAGGMTLTLYTAHIVFINSDLDSSTPVTGFLVQVVVFVVVAAAWWATAGRGPLEGLVTALSRGARRLATWNGRRSRGRVGMSMYSPGGPRGRTPGRAVTDGMTPRPSRRGAT